MTLVRGWCPTALRPMAAGDGLLVRVRPPLGRMTARQAVALAEGARLHGSGAIDLTNRAGLQVRGVSERGWPALVETLVSVGLVDSADDHAPPLLVAPDWREGDDTHRIATALHACRAAFPPLPPKMGIAVDAGAASVLLDSPADFRIERATTGAVMLRAAGRATGAVLEPGAEAQAVVALARWFLESGGAAAGRMARHDAALPLVAAGTLRPIRPDSRARPGAHPLGAIIGAPFGRIDAAALLQLVDAGAGAFRVTPWRMLIAEGVGAGVAESVDPALLSVDACVGAPACPQATVETRALALRLAAHLGDVHVSGCAKGCARAGPAAVMLTGRDGRFDVALAARAGDPPRFAGLMPADVLARFGAD